MTIRAKLYNDAERQERVRAEISQDTREQLFRLKGYLEGVGAPKAMMAAYDEAVEYLVTDHWVSEARL